jgi:GH25 family lysozyme M1 (1,4-beta-N-acetylmuramidase)
MPPMIFKDYPIRGIDISQYNDKPDTVKLPDLEKAKAQGISFVSPRVGYGVVSDPVFSHYWKQAKELGIIRMPYFYLDYYSFKYLKISEEQWGVKQANFAWKILQSDPGECPLMLDVEESVNYGWKFAPENNLSLNKISRNFLTQYDRLSGGKAGIYTSLGYLHWLNDWHRDRPLWMARYNELVTPEKCKADARKIWKVDPIIWQYASHGDVDKDGYGEGYDFGMENPRLDLNIWIDTIEAWAQFSKQTVVTLPPVDKTDKEKLDLLWADYLTRKG